ncbi:MAG TPA: site-specific DNA-methyltransferase [Bellilinea sp.]|nr:site-specific DNA-methyltransferase [Bellilinea sp.]
MPYIPLKDQSINLVVTSPPYFGLRSYDIPSSVWGGDPTCKHEWDFFIRKGQSGGKNSEKLQIKGEENFQIVHDQDQGYCTVCGAWFGQHGSEPTIAMFLEHEVEIFREVRRVLRDDGVLFLNMGDSYNGSGGAGGDYAKGGLREGQPKYKPIQQANLKRKDLMGIPWRLAIALQDDGWYLRSDIIWSKPNNLPEGRIDRPSKSHEYIFLLTKSEKYFWNYAYKENVGKPSERRKTFRGGRYVNNETYNNSRGLKDKPSVSNDRPSIEGTRPRTVWTIATQGYTGAHFATFPEKLVEKCIALACPKGGVVFDPFLGSGTVVQVAQRMGRIGIGTELGWDYIQQAKVRTGRTALSRWQGETQAQGETALSDLPLFGEL